MANDPLHAAGNLDEVLPYPHRAYPQSHPDLLATVATVFGLRPAPVERCRVLELGCSSGGNLIPMADALPGATFVGIDVSLRQIATGQAVARAAGVSNVELRRQSILEFPADAGAFDYIIAHGVYTWVPRAVQDRVLEICRQHLSPHGVAYISYNTFPGWHFNGLLRETMHKHLGASAAPATPSEQIRQARAVLDFFSTGAPIDRPVPGGPFGGAYAQAWGAMLKAFADATRALPDVALFHEQLADDITGLAFPEFVARARSAGLQYLGEAQVETMSTASLGPHVEMALRGIATDWIAAEQYLDVLRCRTFRQTLVVRDDAALHRQIDPLWVKSLYIGSPAEPAPDDGAHETAETFQHPKGSQLSTSDPLLRAALRALADAWPSRLAFPDLLAAAWQRMGLGPTTDVAMSGAPEAKAPTDAVEKKLCSFLLQGFFTGMVELSVRPAGWATALPERPAVRRLARLQSETDDTVTTLRHQNLKLNRMARQLLRLLDGTRTRDQILRDLEKEIRDSAKAIGGKVIMEPQDRARLGRAMDQDLKRFVGEGLLQP